MSFEFPAWYLSWYALTPPPPLLLFLAAYHDIRFLPSVFYGLSMPIQYSIDPILCLVARAGHALARCVSQKSGGHMNRCWHACLWAHAGVHRAKWLRRWVLCISNNFTVPSFRLFLQWLWDNAAKMLLRAAVVVRLTTHNPQPLDIALCS